MNNLKIIYQNNPEMYKETLRKLSAELKVYSETVEKLYNEKEFIELKMVSHTIRNIAGSIGQSKLKILAAYWEDICVLEKFGDINEFKQTIKDVLVEIQKEEIF